MSTNISALWRYKAERDHHAADTLVWCSYADDCCADNYIRCVSCENWQLQYQYKSRVWDYDWSNMVHNVYATVSLHGAIVKKTENRLIVNVYLQELCYISLVMNLWGITKEDLCIEAQERGKNLALIINSSLYEAIFKDLKGVNCASLETVHAEKYSL